MATQGPSMAGTGADDAAIGTFAWANPDRITADDGSFATGSQSGSVRVSHYLKGTNFGFAIWIGVVSGLTVEWKRKTSGGKTTCIDSNAKIVKADASIGTTNRSTGTAWTTTSAYKTFGSVSDLWGESWTPANINSSNFGAVLTCTTSLAPTASVDAVRITVTYGVWNSPLLEMFLTLAGGLSRVIYEGTFCPLVGGVIIDASEGMLLCQQTRYPRHAESVPIPHGGVVLGERDRRISEPQGVLAL